MGLGVLTGGSWSEPRDVLVSTAVGALAFWLLGAAVGLCVSSKHPTEAFCVQNATGGACLQLL